MTVLVLLVPALAFWPRGPLDAYDAPKLGLVALLLALAPWASRSDVEPSRWRWPLFVLTCALLVGALFAPHQATFWFGSPQRGQGVLALLLCGLLFAWAARSFHDATGLLRGAQLATALVAGLALLQWLGVDPLRTDASRPSATMGNPVLLGQWLVLMLPLCVSAVRSATRPFLAWVVVLIGVLALIASGSRGAWLGGLIATLWFGMSAMTRCRRRVWWGAFAAGAGLLLCATIWLRPASVEHRLQLWGAAVQVLRAPPVELWPDGSEDGLAALRPWVGYGGDAQAMPMRLAMVSRPQFPADPDRAHNLLLDLLLRYGVLGILGSGYAAAWLVVILRRGVRARIPVVTACTAGLSGWLLSLATGFAGTADSVAAALITGVAVAACGPNTAPRLIRAGATGAALRTALLVAALGIWLSPPAWLPAHWRQPEQALLAFEQARSLLSVARASTAISAADSCVAGAAAIGALSRSTSLDATRPEYRAALLASRLAWCSRCHVSSAMVQDLCKS